MKESEVLFLLLSLVAAVLLHECGHILLLYISGGKITGIKLSAFGIVIKTSSTSSYWQETAVALAGPFFGFIGFLLFQNASGDLALFAKSSLALAIFNLLPVTVLDGGRAFSSLLHMLLPFEKASLWAKGVSLFFTLLLWIASVYIVLFCNGNSSLFLLSLWLFFSLLFPEKKPLPKTTRILRDKSHRKD